ncbi:MAG: hypothetical protein Q8R55_00795 [Candidatus Taylorbacteria bacterium]|nr:hypothetical protein [Candidatus Taylorbacteria bacterium]
MQKIYKTEEEWKEILKTCLAGRQTARLLSEKDIASTASRLNLKTRPYGAPFVKVEEVLACKKDYNRPKDLEDIKAIEDYIRNHNVEDLY